MFRAWILVRPGGSFTADEFARTRWYFGDYWGVDLLFGSGFFEAILLICN
jgi:hypothetical protein